MKLQEGYTTLFQDFPQTPRVPRQNHAAIIESPNLANDPAFDVGDTLDLMNNDFAEDENSQDMFEDDMLKLSVVKPAEKPKQSPSPQRIPSTILPQRAVDFIPPAPIPKKAPPAQVVSAPATISSNESLVADYRRLSKKVLEALHKAADQEKSVLSNTLCDLMLSGGNEFDKNFLISERYACISFL